MAGPARSPLTTADIGCWVIKSATAPGGIEPGWAAGERRVVSRCLRASYRLDLMAPGQRCLLWLSGRAEPGVHAIGTLAAAPTRDNPAVDVAFWLLASPVPREELLHAPALESAEVLRMPAGSNPSYLTPVQLTALLGHLDEDERAAAGWS